MCVSQDRSFWDRTVCGTRKFMYMTFQMWVACTQLGVGWRASMVTMSPSQPSSSSSLGTHTHTGASASPCQGQGIMTH